MRTPQAGIFALGTGAHSYLEFDALPGVAPVDVVSAIAGLDAPQETTGGVNLVVGFAPGLWRAAGGSIPDAAHGFDAPVTGPDGFSMPATQRSLWVWCAGHAYDRVFDVSLEVISTLAATARLVTETQGWTYREGRDLTGFIDGSENPTLREAPAVALVPDGQPGAGGSVVLIQLWSHDAAAWAALDDAEQERVIGRTKPDSVEIPDEVRSASSHVTRNVIEDDGGGELEIFRRNAPYGGPGEHGTVFIGFSADQERLSRMLDRMAGIPDGVRDDLTRYTSALTGAYYFVPCVEDLAAFAQNM